ncbi:GNAT family N-acetyltransferase [Bacillus sp. SCS-153A]|uniref:GNAT family N-acetyltransferase n=1 Tax=Rossellomorea sedimentorum TaxID=3115294 RepID=UPI003906A306
MYKFLPMTDETAKEIAYHWNYEGEYSFYNMTEDQEDLEEFLHPARSGYYTVEKNGEIIGYYCFQNSESGSVEIGLGMKPTLTGKGRGLEFVLEGMKFAFANYQPRKLSLSVATFNKRAIGVYEKAGFSPVKTFMQDTNGSTYEFLKMEYESEGE